MKIILTIGFLLGIFLQINLYGQISKGGSPLSFQQNKSLKSAQRISTPIISMPEIPVSLTPNEIIQNNEKLKPFKFAHPFEVNISPEKDGFWSTHGNYRVWKVGIHSKGAFSLNLIFDNYKLPEGAKLYIYNNSKTKVIGAFTSANNKATGKLATSPIPGDLIYVTYEEPLDAEFKGELKIGQVNHDYKGIYNVSMRRPLGKSDTCNWDLDINCVDFIKWHKENRATLRILVGGTELCTGVLLNNTKEDNTPYLLTAHHCIENASDAGNALFYFNYESPTCHQLDGIIEQIAESTRTLSSSEYLAGATNLDFSLVKLSVPPPPEYQPYLAGWNREESAPTGSVCIHHPSGDIKKIAIDDHQSYINSYSSDWVNDGFIRIAKWENGTTEGGSSGAPLFNTSGQVVGTLTGGSATCSNPIDDYFSRFYSQWDHYSEKSKSLIQFLDPNTTQKTNINGKEMYPDLDRVYALSNFKNNELNKSISVSKEYLAGHNSKGATEFVEEFIGYDNTSLKIYGVSIGFNRLFVQPNSRFKLKIYEGENGPNDQNPVYEESINPNEYEQNAMNYISFKSPVNLDVNKKFYVGYEITYTSEPSDTIAAFIAEKRSNNSNSAWVKVGNKWLPFSSKDYYSYPTSLFLEVWASGLEDTTSTSHPYDQNKFDIYPNPVLLGQNTTVILPDDIKGKVVFELYDIQGSKVYTKKRIITNSRSLDLMLKNLSTGIYILTVKADKFISSQKITVYSNL